MPKQYALVSDFDGTISDNDFFYAIADRYFDEKALAPWHEYINGRKKHFDALNEMFGLLRAPEKELKSFIKEIKIDKTFFKLADFCLKHQIPVCILSAGCDYYINILIQKEIEKYQIRLITNHGTYNQKNGLKMTANKEYYDKNLGTSKQDVIADLKHQGYHVIYCGDGLPDIEPAKLSDTVFARKTLYQQCQKANIPAHVLTDFSNVTDYIKEHLP